MREKESIDGEIVKFMAILPLDGFDGGGKAVLGVGEKNVKGWRKHLT